MSTLLVCWVKGARVEPHVGGVPWSTPSLPSPLRPCLQEGVCRSCAGGQGQRAVKNTTRREAREAGAERWTQHRAVNGQRRRLAGQSHMTATFSATSLPITAQINPPLLVPGRNLVPAGHHQTQISLFAFLVHPGRRAEEPEEGTAVGAPDTTHAEDGRMPESPVRDC